MRRFITAIVVGATTFVVYLAAVGDSTANRAATCPVRISEECQAQHPSLRPYETLRFPVARTVLADGGVQILLPRAAEKVAGALRDCIEVVNWAQCDLESCASRPGVCTAWGDANPFTRVRTASKHVIPDCRRPDGGWDDGHAEVDCRRAEGDGGYRWIGCNTFRRDMSIGAACLDAPSGVVFAGERIEDSL